MLSSSGTGARVDSIGAFWVLGMSTYKPTV